ncbi:MAG: hypothetical protein Q9160_007749 [Pyrenula sp. 1 TL-2023]
MGIKATIHQILHANLLPPYSTYFSFYINSHSARRTAIPATPARPLAIAVAIGTAAPDGDDEGAAAELAPEPAAPAAPVAEVAAALPSDEALEAMDDAPLDADPAAELAAELASLAAELAPLTAELAAELAPLAADEAAEPAAPAKMVVLPTVEVRVEPSEVMVDTIAEVVMAEPVEPPSVPVADEASLVPEAPASPVKAEVAGALPEPEETGTWSVNGKATEHQKNPPAFAQY